MPAPYTVKQAKHATLAVASTAEQVNVNGGRTALVSARGSADVYFTLGYAGAAPAAAVVGADDNYVVPAGTSKAVDSQTGSSITGVSVNSAAATAYSVEVV